MKYILSILLFIGATAHTHAQTLDIDIRKDWYGVVPTVDMTVLDTIVLYPVHGNFEQAKDVFLWRYLGGSDYQLKIYNNTMPGAYDHYELAPEQWKLKEKKGGYYLVVKDQKDPRPFHKKIAGYQVVPQYSNYNILQSIMLIKRYNNRYAEQLKTPALRN